MKCKESNTLKTLMNNYDSYLELVKQAEAADGTTLENQQIYLDTITAKIETTKTQIQEFWNNIISSDFIKNLVDGLNSALSVINKISGVLGSFGTLALGGGIFALIKNKSAISNLIAMGTAMNALNAVTASGAVSNEAYAASLTGLTLAQKATLLSRAGLTKEEALAIITTGALTEAEKANAAATIEQTFAQKTSLGIVGSLSAGFKGLAASIGISTAALGVIAGVAAAIGVAVVAYNHFNETLEEAQEKAEKSKQAYDGTITELNDLNAQLETTKTRMDELNSKESLTIIEQSEYNKLQNTNEELERQIKLKEYIAKIDGQKASDDAVNAINKKSESYTDEGKVAAWRRKTPGIETEGEGTRIDAANYYIDEATKAQKAVAEANAKMKEIEAKRGENVSIYANDEEWKKAKESMEDAQKEADSAKQKASKYITDIQKEAEALYDANGNAFNGAGDTIEKISEISNKMLGLEAQEDKYIGDKITNAFSDADISKLKEGILSGAITAKDIENNKKYSNSLKAIGVSAQELILYIQDLVDAEKAAGEETKEPVSFNQFLNDSKDAIDNLQSGVASLGNELSKLYSKDYSSSDLLDSIQKISEITSGMGYDFNWDYIAQSADPLKTLGDTIDYVSQKYVDSFLAENNIDPDSKFGQLIKNVTEDALKLNAQLEAMNDSADELQSSYSTLGDIVKKYNEDGYITMDNLQALLKMSPEYIACLSEENGQLTINQESLKALANQRLNDAETAAVQQAVSQLNMLALNGESEAIDTNATSAQNASKQIGEYNIQLSNTFANAVGATAALNGLNDALNGAEAAGASQTQIDTVMNNLQTELDMINTMRQQINSGNFDGVLGNSKSSSKSKSYVDQGYRDLLDEIDNQNAKVKDKIDYLKSLMDLEDAKGNTDGVNAYRKQIQDMYSTLEDQLHDGNEKLREEREKLFKEVQGMGYFGNIESAGDLSKLDVEKVKRQLEQAKNDASDNDAESERVSELTSKYEELTSAILDMNDAIKSNSDEWLSTRKDQLNEYLEMVNSEIDRWQDVYDANDSRRNVVKVTLDVSDADYYDKYSALLQEEYDEKVAQQERFMGKYNDLSKRGFVEEARSAKSEWEKLEADKTNISKEMIEARVNYQKNQADSLEDLQSKVIEMIKSEDDKTKDLLEKQKDAIKDAADAKKQELEAQKDLLNAKKDEYDYQRKINDLKESIAEKQSDLNALEYDSSSDSIQAKIDLANGIREDQKSLADEEFNHSIEAATDAIDKAIDAIDADTDMRQKLIEAQIDVISNKTDLDYRNQANTMIDSDAGLYDKLVHWNAELGDGYKTTIDELYANAKPTLDSMQESQTRIADELTMLKDNILVGTLASTNVGATAFDGTVISGGGITLNSDIIGTSISNVITPFTDGIKQLVENLASKPSNVTVSPSFVVQAKGDVSNETLNAAKSWFTNTGLGLVAKLIETNIGVTVRNISGTTK